MFFLGKGHNLPERIKERRRRKRERGSKRGRELEDWMRGFLKEIQDSGDIDGFTAHAPYSVADKEGKDFTVWRKENEGYRRVSFNVTISLRKQNEFRLKHPEIPLIVIPPEMNPERIRERVLELFEK